MGYEQRRKFFSIVLLAAMVGTVVVLTAWASDRSWSRNGSFQLERNQPGLYSVTNFIDGDTIAVDMNGSSETIRMIGVDTPETHRPNTPVQCFGPQAAEYTKQLIGKNRVRLQADPLDTNRDRYGRLLRYVYLPDGRLLERELIANGYGFAYTSFPFTKSDEFEMLETQAKTTKKGLWASCQVHIEDNGRQQTNPQS